MSSAENHPPTVQKIPPPVLPAESIPTSESEVQTLPPEPAVVISREEHQKEPLILVKMVSGSFQNLLQQVEEKIKKSGSGESRGKGLALSLKNQLVRYVTHLHVQEASAESDTPQKKFPWSPLLIIGLPTLIAFFYFGFVASDQYESNADYILKSEEPSAKGIDALSLIGLGSGDSETAKDEAMLESYIGSEQILKDLASEVDLRKIYCSDQIDYFSRLRTTPDFFKTLTGRKTRRTTNQKISDEDLLRYWKKKVQVIPGDKAGTSTLRVRAFTPEDAKNIADHVLSLGEKLVNRVSERSMADAVNFAQQEVDSARVRANQASVELKNSQVQSQQVDPLGNAKSEFAAKDYQAALAALETARIDASRQSRYLEAFDLPQLPDKPSLPNRWYSIITVLALSALFYGIWSLFIAGVKEHQH